MDLENINFNYFKIIGKNGEVVGVCGAEVGSENELSIIEDVLELGYKPVKITKEEYENYDEGDEIGNF